MVPTNVLKTALTELNKTTEPHAYHVNSDRVMYTGKDGGTIRLCDLKDIYSITVQNGLVVLDGDNWEMPIHLTKRGPEM